jgi:hypothetical protein
MHNYVIALLEAHFYLLYYWYVCSKYVGYRLHN